MFPSAQATESGVTEVRSTTPPAPTATALSVPRRHNPLSGWAVA